MNSKPLTMIKHSVPENITCLIFTPVFYYLFWHEENQHIPPEQRRVSVPCRAKEKVDCTIAHVLAGDFGGAEERRPVCPATSRVGLR